MQVRFDSALRMTRPARGLLLALVLAACRPGDAGVVTEPSTPTPSPQPPTEPDPDTDTGVETETDVPELLEVSCTPTLNPLRFTCEVEVDPPQAVELRYARVDGESVERVHASPDVQAVHDIPVYFLAGERDYTVVAAAGAGTAETGFTTGTVHDVAQTWLEVTGTSTLGLVGTDIPCGTDPIAVVYDTNTGDLVWYADVGPGKLSLIDMLSFTDRGTVLAETGTDVVEIDLMGEELVRLEDVHLTVGADLLNLGMHHDVFSRGDLYYVMFRREYATPSDVLDVVAIVNSSGELVASWDPADHLTIPTDWSGDWLHTNSIWVDEVGDIYLSWTSIHTVGKIKGDPDDPDFGALQWAIAGRTERIEDPHLTVDWSSGDGDDEFWHQHNMTITPTGQVAMLDNGNGRGLVLDLDEAAGTATAVGNYPTDKEICGSQGTTRVATNGNVIVACQFGLLREYDGQTAELLWEAEAFCQEKTEHGVNVARWTPLENW